MRARRRRRAGWFVPVSLVFLVVVVTVALQVFLDRRSPTEQLAVLVPELSAPARLGETAFVRECMACHGPNAAGSSKGPPLVHSVYRAAHHADAAFALAVRHGVRQHHWRFGDMPPVASTAPSDVDAIVRYVRELQAANGIR